MLLYTILILLILIYGLFEKEKPLNKVNPKTLVKKRNSINVANFFLSAIFIFIFALIAFRGDFSSDYINYERHFLIARNMSWNDLFTSGYRIGGTGGVEVGFYILMKLISYFSTDPIWLFIIVALITLIPVYKSIRDESKSRWLSLLLYIVFGSFITSFNVMRAIFAYSLLFSRRQYLYERKYIKYLIFIFFISMFHLSSIVMVAFILLDAIKLKNEKFILFIIPSSLLVFIFSDKLILLGDRLLYNSFFTSIYRHGIREVSFGNVIAPLLLGLMVIIGTFLVKEKDRRYDLLLKASAIWVVFRFLMINFIEMRRFADMMSFYMVLYFPYMIAKLPSDKTTKSIIKIILAIATIALFYYTMKDSPYNPYYFIWDRR